MKKKTCLDCLHCKVSVKSTRNCRLCFCSKAEKKENHQEFYWLIKKLCDNFFDMTETTRLAFFHARPNPAMTKKRKPLLRNRAF